MLLYPVYYDIISLTSLKITQVFHLLLGFAGNPVISWYFKIRNSICITESSDNGDLDNRGSTVYNIYTCVCVFVCVCVCVCVCVYIYIYILCKNTFGVKKCGQVK